MDAGGLVSDEICIGILKEQMDHPDNKGGVIIDGVPRTMPQVEMIDKLMQESGKKITKVIEFYIPEQMLIERIQGRRIHQDSGRSYHVKFHPPQVDGKDDVTGEDLIQRKDDNSDSLMTRLDIYQKQSKPILEHYMKQGLVLRIDAN